MSELEEDSRDLWTLTFSPAIWAAHFMASYITTTIWCAKLSLDGSLGHSRTLVAAYTLVALLAIGFTGWQGYRRHRHGSETRPHDFDSREDRQRFLGFATLLLSGLSAVATIYSALAPLWITSCQ